MNALDFSIQKTHHTLRPTAVVAGPTLRSLEKIEEMCSVLVQDDPSKQKGQDLNVDLSTIHKMWWSSHVPVSCVALCRFRPVICRCHENKTFFI